MKKILLLVCLVCIGTFAFAQPANDLCANATALPVGVSGACAGIVGSNTAATDSGETPAPGCASYSGGDSWFTVVVPAGGDFTVEVSTSGGFTDGGMSIYDGTCGAFISEIECDDDDGPGLFPAISLTGQTPGAILYVRVWEFGNNSFGDFSICAYEPAGPPANDDCINATALTPGVACSAVSGTVEAATDSGESTTCTGTEDDDVWYSFVASNATQNVEVSNLAGSTTDVAMGVFSGACGALVNEGCTDTNTGFQVTGLTPGQTYYVQFYTWSSTGGQTTTFDICITEPAPPPANDDCINATVLTPGVACSAVSGTVDGATDSGESTTCTGTEDDDVWYSFVANGPIQNVEVSNLAGSTTDVAMGVFSGACGALVNEGCTDTNTGFQVTGLTPGQTYYIQFYTWSSTGGQDTTFDICVTDPPPPPVNDDCANATPLPVAMNSQCNSTVGDNSAATDSGATPAPSCASYSGGDLWYEVTIPASGEVIVEMSTAGGFTDGGMSIYSGTCAALAEVECDDDDGPGLFPMIMLTGQTPGTVFYVRVWEFGNNSFGEFNICAYETTVPVELLSFEGQAEEKVNTITWETASELNTQWHIVERSVEGSDKWEELGRLKAAGESVATLRYEFVDVAPLEEAYYRLRTMDFDGSEETSNVIFVSRSIKQFGIVNVSPVPTKDVVTVDYITTRASTIQVSVTDMFGKKIRNVQTQVNEGANQLQLNLDGLSSGFYLIRMDDGQNSSLRRIVKH